MNTFIHAVRDALDHVGDFAWLGRESPLSAPYFLSNFLDNGVNNTSMATDEARGMVLRDVFHAKHDLLWDEESTPEGELSYQYLEEILKTQRALLDDSKQLSWFYLLELRYFRRYYCKRYPEKLDDLPDHLGYARATFFRKQSNAIEEFAEVLLSQTRPSLRSEQPILQTELLGREEYLNKAVDALKQKRAVALTGSGGIGKTALGSAIVKAWPVKRRFWYTFRPGLSDNMQTLLRSLGDFLHHQCNASELYKNLVASLGAKDGIDVGDAIGYLRADLVQVDDKAVFCFDEVDALRSSHPEHRKLIEFLVSLTGSCPLLLIGQRVMIDTNMPLELTPLEEDDCARLLSRWQTVDPTVLKQICAYTAGVPRAIELVGFIWQTVTPLTIYSQNPIGRSFPCLNVYGVV